jgi:hypothetical protein
MHYFSNKMGLEQSKIDSQNQTEPERTSANSDIESQNQNVETSLEQKQEQEQEREQGQGQVQESLQVVQSSIEHLYERRTSHMPSTPTPNTTPILKSEITHNEEIGKKIEVVPVDLTNSIDIVMKKSN